ncbi:hypothetical protein LCGC14_1043040 [marine sediment metagenome]|uniref:Uncharacterized protein n=1 Tax=marine sediment metagenome TaxID=412755 RepID=A0A0F9Q9F9_9ZZZZ
MRPPGFGLDIEFVVMTGGGSEMDLHHHGGERVYGCVGVDVACLLGMVRAVLVLDPDAEVKIRGCTCGSCTRARVDQEFGEGATPYPEKLPPEELHLGEGDPFSCDCETRL